MFPDDGMRDDPLNPAGERKQSHTSAAQNAPHTIRVPLWAEYNIAAQVHPCMYQLEHCTTISFPPFILASALPNRHHLPNGCSRAFIQALASLSDDLHEDHLEQGSDRHGLLLSSNGRDYAGTDVLYAVQIHLEVFKELDFGQVLSGRLRQPPCLVAKSNKYISFVQKNARRLFLALRVMVIQCKRADVLSVVRKPLPSVGPARSVVPDVYRNHRVSFCRRAQSVAAEGFPALAGSVIPARGAGPLPPAPPLARHARMSYDLRDLGRELRD